MNPNLNVVTLTLNPALDVATSVARLAPARGLRCSGPRVDAGSGGLNVARVMRRLAFEQAAASVAPHPPLSTGMLKQSGLVSPAKALSYD